MSAIFLPILLIIGALSAILVVFGRHLPAMARSFRERKEQKELSELSDQQITELPVNPHTHQLTQPQENTFGFTVSKVRQQGKFILVKFIWVMMHLWRVVKFSGQLVAKLFHRVPRIKPSLAVFSRGKKETDADVDYKNIEEFTQPIMTTSDIKSVKKNPLRYPEPISDELSELTQSKKSKTTEKPKEEISASVESQVEAIIEEVKAEQPKVEAKKVEAEVVVEKPAFSVEKTKETRTPNRRRIVGKMAPKPTPLQELEKTIMAEEPEAKEVFTVRDVEEVAVEPVAPIEEKKMSFIDREAYALTDATQEISNQILEGKYNVAESALIDILSKNPRNTEAYRLLGIVYLKRKDFEQAREVFEEALRRDPDHGGLQGPLGYCYMSVGEYGKALSMYQQAHNMDETNIEYLEQLLIISSRMDRRPLVNMTAKKILALNPNHVEAKKYLARVAVR
ncbi:MAG: tetratricopeptide repeat protein [bacterium]|nr:tetratricopeptide repeat protein [bacterium]